MAKTHGKSGVFKLATVAAPSSVVDISSYLTDFELPEEFDEDEVTALQDTVKQFLLGLPDSQLSLSGNYDPVINAQLSNLALFDTPVNWEAYHAGTATGQSEYAGTCRVISFRKSHPVNGKGSFTLTLQQASNITRTVL